MDYDDFVILMISIACFVFGMAVGVMLFMVTAVHVHAQTNITETAPNPNLKFVPQPAYISIGNPNQNEPVQTQSSSSSGGLGEVLISVIVTAIGVIAAKFHSDGKISKVKDLTKENMGEILHDKKISQELARLLYQFNPEKAKAIDDAPSVKLETMKNDTEEFEDKTAKS